jgi:hypothetical protein
MRRVAGAMNRIGCRTVALVSPRHRTWRNSFAKGNSWPGTTVAANGHTRKPDNLGRCGVRAPRQIQTDAKRVTACIWR